MMLSLVPMSTTVTPPAFPGSFYVGSQLSVGINKGGATYDASGGMCCSKINSSQCSFETVSEGQDVYQSTELKMHRFGSVIHNYTTNWPSEDSGREMAVTRSSQTQKYANSTHKWACVEWCPLQSNQQFYDLIDIGDGRKRTQVSFVRNVTVTQSHGQPGLCILRSCRTRLFRGHFPTMRARPASKN